LSLHLWHKDELSGVRASMCGYCLAFRCAFTLIGCHSYLFVFCRSFGSARSLKHQTGLCLFRIPAYNICLHQWCVFPFTGIASHLHGRDVLWGRSIILSAIWVTFGSLRLLMTVLNRKWAMLCWPTLAHLVIDSLRFKNFVFQVLNNIAGHLKLLYALLVLSELAHLPISFCYNAQLTLFVVFGYLKVVYFLQKHNVFFHETAAHLFWFFNVLRHLSLKLVNLLLQVISVSLNTGCSTSACSFFRFVFFKHILLV